MQKCAELNDLICFKIYAASKAITKLYNLELKPLGLTYPQYLVLIILYKEDNISVKQIGKELHLDSGTLTPLLKRLEKNGLVDRKRSQKDERTVNILLTPKALSLKDDIAALTDNLQHRCRKVKGCNEDDTSAINRFLDSVVEHI